MSGDNCDFVALIPAAGRGTRLGDLPCSKELIPLVPGAGNPFVAAPGTPVAIEATLRMLAGNRIGSAIVVTTAEKADIPAYLGDGTGTGVAVSHVVRRASPGVPHTLSSALPQLGNRKALLVFPDILIRPPDAVGRLVSRHRDSGADVTLALVPSERGDKVDIVETDDTGRVTAVMPKPGAGRHGWTWIAAAWGPRFSALLADFADRNGTSPGRETFVGDVINTACQAGLSVLTLHIPEGEALDIGTPEDLERLWQKGFRTSPGP